MTRMSKRGQVTIVDLVLVPIVAVVLSVTASYLMTSSTASLLTSVNQQPVQDACNFALNDLYGTYFVGSSAALNELKLLHPSQYAVAVSQPAESLSTGCGSSCSAGYTYLSSTLSNSSALYNDFISYFSSLSFSNFNLIKTSNSVALSDSNMHVFLQSVPSGVTYSSLCSLTVYNPINPSNPYTIYGVVG